MPALTDKEFDDLMEEKRQAKITIKNGGFKVVTVKRVRKLIDRFGNVIARKKTFYSETDTLIDFAKLIKGF